MTSITDKDHKKDVTPTSNYRNGSTNYHDQEARGLSIMSEEKEDGPTRIMNKLRLVPGCGLVFAILSAIFFAVGAFTVELMDNVVPCFVVTTMSITQFVFFLPIALYFNEPLSGVKGERFAVLQRSICGYIAFLLGYQSLSFLSFSDVQSILFSSPVYVSIFAFFILKEPCGLFQVVSIIVTLCGVAMVARPTFIFGSVGTEEDVFTPEERIIGVILCFIVSFSISFGYIAIRQMKKTPTVVVIIMFSLFSIIAGSITMVVWYYVARDSFILPHSTTDWILIGVNGMAGVLAQTSLVLSLKLEEAGLVSLIRTFDIVCAFFFQCLFLNQPVYWQSIVGAVIICSGCVAVALKKYLESSKR